MDALLTGMVESGLAGDPPRHGKPRAPWLERAERFIERHFTSRNVVRKTASEAGVSVEHLVRVFRARHGLTPGQYARQLRLLAGLDYLQRSRVSIAEAATLAGFSDQPHFTRVIRLRARTTPSRFRSRRRP